MRSSGVVRLRIGRHSEGAATNRTAKQRQRTAENRRELQSKGRELRRKVMRGIAKEMLGEAMR